MTELLFECPYCGKYIQTSLHLKWEDRYKCPFCQKDIYISIFYDIEEYPSGYDYR